MPTARITIRKIPRWISSGRRPGGARQYLWLTTPYLVIDQELSSTLCLAARGGVDVRICTLPSAITGMSGWSTGHNYRHLVKNGVQIYRYTPGFIHGKLMLWDDRCATVVRSTWISAACFSTMKTGCSSATRRWWPTSAGISKRRWRFPTGSRWTIFRAVPGGRRCWRPSSICSPP